MQTSVVSQLHILSAHPGDVCKPPVISGVPVFEPLVSLYAPLNCILVKGHSTTTKMLILDEVLCINIPFTAET